MVITCVHCFQQVVASVVCIIMVDDAHKASQSHFDSPFLFLYECGATQVHEMYAMISTVQQSMLTYGTVDDDTIFPPS